MSVVTITASGETVTGRFEPTDTPILEVEPGQTVRFSTCDVTWGTQQHDVEVVSGDRLGERRCIGVGQRQVLESRDIGINGGPAMCGPVAVKGANPGMTLAVHIDAIVPGEWGWTYVGPSHFEAGMLEEMGLEEGQWGILRWTLDVDSMTAKSETGHVVAMSPFMGTIGLSPATPRSGWLPGRTGGNLDCSALVEGSVLYLPIELQGGRFYVGDGHARQGDGEVGGSAIECPMRRVDLRFEIIEGMSLHGPLARTPTGWVAMGVGEDLRVATVNAMKGMLALLESELGVSKVDAMALASVCVDLRITQVVNGQMGVHAVLPHGTITRP